MTLMASAPRRFRDGQKLVLPNVSWQTYQDLGDVLQDRSIRLTYDRGALEIMVVSPEHERFKGLFGLLVFTLARFFHLKIGVFGSFTHQRKDLARGLEPDQCFYLARLAAVKGKKRINLKRDPPPDLAIEVDITRSSLDRMGIYAALGVIEVWRFDGKALQVYLLEDGAYKLSGSSPTFPDVSIKDLVQFLRLGQREDDVTMVETLEAWLGKRTGQKEGARKGKTSR
jgi:Uma2 family endonuclease